MTTSPLGTPVNRVDGRLKVTGAAKYAADNALDGMVHGYLLLSTVGRGTIRAMDVATAERAPGVLAIYTPFNPLKLFASGGFGGPPWLPLQDREVRHYGHIIGVVVAETFETARDAAALVRVDYDARSATVSFTDNIPNAVPPQGGPDGGEPPVLDILADGMPSIDAALAAADVRVSASFSQPFENHNAMEPHASVAVWRDERMTVYSGTQNAGGHARSIAGALGIDAARVHVISPHVGGGFGNKAATWTHDLVTTAAARALGRPVRTVLTREQTFTVTGHRSTVAQTVALGARRDGTLVALKHEGFSSTGISGSTPENGPFTTGRVLYKTENMHISQKVVRLDLPSATFMRAPGECSGSFALESAMDELAVALQIDPVQLRLRNYATNLPGTDRPWSSKHLDECYQLGAQRFGWHRRSSAPRATQDGDWLVGMGMATAIYPANRSDQTVVRVRLQPDGTASVATATADLGTGMWTVLAIMGADSLGIPLHRINPELGDSLLPPSAGAFGSQSTASVAPATRAAAASAIKTLIDLAVQDERSPFHGLDPVALRYDHGDLVAADRRMSFGRLLSQLNTPGVEASAPGTGGDPERYEFHSFGAHFCEVAVHRRTGEPTVRRLMTVADAGQIVNLKAARSQMVGGAIFGIGQALFEGSYIEAPSGRWANANLADYLLAVNADIPPIDIHFLNHPDTAFNPVGARGIGELGTVGVAAAIGNAIYNATGKRIRDLPITLDKLLD
jgi:xanthine dehydrogenase YagR molybdenum-binding subunit